MKIHSYKSTSYDCRCDGCDYVCESSYTMDMHIGKKHKEELERGLCECKFDNLEVLEIHQVTCEVYQCGNSDCKERVKTISEIKKHLAEVHGHWSSNASCLHQNCQERFTASECEIALEQ